uniref:Uncharacterized protein n=1 Tax=Bartonella schoenbuchensis (strain DSM 13525 / NCTC 13165 / R1) TaxID=687861 RepID=E6Z198_BARSR|nr:hypothetical protein BARSC_190159 [Bartonella schoenbuchensis R1]
MHSPFSLHLLVGPTLFLKMANIHKEYKNTTKDIGAYFKTL